MAPCYVFKQESSKKTQSPKDDSFIGGKPKLPKDASIPRCKLCRAEESFFFQVAILEGVWQGFSVAVFACTSCASRGHFIPEMLKGTLHGITIPEKFLGSYQDNFRFLVFDAVSAVLHEKYQERVKFKRISLVLAKNPKVDDSKIGGEPNWILEDESPGSYAGKADMFFLLQLGLNFRFEITDDAPRQMTFGIGGIKLSTWNHYELFIGNKIYLFGVKDRSIPLIYAITQVDR